MASSPAEFLVFSLLAVALLLGVGVRHRAWALALANLAFLQLVFFWGERNLVLLLAVALGNFVLLRAMEDPVLLRGRSWLAGAGIVAHVGLLILAHLGPGLAGRPLVLVGFAWVFLRQVHLIVETAAGSRVMPLGFVAYFNYVFFFPTFLTGPVCGFDDMEASLAKRGRLGADEVLAAVRRIIVGSFKISVVSYGLTRFTLPALEESALAMISTSRILVSVALYGPWLYFTFSGATDVSIGIARLLGVDLPENFRLPFAAANLQEFWRRWHMSLLRWTREYLFLPLQLTFADALPGYPGFTTALALLTGFCLLGLWHGVSVHHLRYGLYHGVGMVAFLVWSRIRGAPKSGGRWRPAGRALSWTVTWVFISVGWLFFLGRESVFVLVLRRLAGGA